MMDVNQLPFIQYTRSLVYYGGALEDGCQRIEHTSHIGIESHAAFKLVGLNERSN